VVDAVEVGADATGTGVVGAGVVGAGVVGTRIVGGDDVASLAHKCAWKTNVFCLFVCLFFAHGRSYRYVSFVLRTTRLFL
jgi:hypothetical protein